MLLFYLATGWKYLVIRFAQETGSAAIGGIGLLVLPLRAGYFDLGLALMLDLTHSHNLALKFSSLFSVLIDSFSIFISFIPL